MPAISFISDIMDTVKVSHQQINHILTVVVAAAALYIAVVPYIPKIVWQFKDKTAAAPYAGVLRGNVDTPAKEFPKDNRIVIPSALVDQPIVEGSGLWLIDEGGTWRKNLHVASPKEDGNTVIVGHRFTYKNPEGAFYNLDRVKLGDKLAVYWEGEELLYEVKEIKTVPETAIEVEYNTLDRTLTLYTCTPLVSAENRLVVIAKPVGVGP